MTKRISKRTSKRTTLGWTTFEESERLVEAGLDSNTADMMYQQTPQDVSDLDRLTNRPKLLTQNLDYNTEKKNMEEFYSYYDIPMLFKPCWSLGKLFDLLPETLNDDGVQYTRHSRNDDSEFGIEYYSSEYSHALKWWCGEVIIEVVVDALAWLSEHGYLNHVQN